MLNNISQLFLMLIVITIGIWLWSFSIKLGSVIKENNQSLIKEINKLI